MRIICATDFSEQGRAAIELGAALASRLGDQLTCLYVVDPTSVLGPDPVDAHALGVTLSAAAERELARALERIATRGVRAESLVLKGPTADKIVEAAGAPDTRLLVMGTHGRKGLPRLVLGSVAEHVASHAACPVLVTHGMAADERLGAGRRLSLLVGVEASAAADAAVDWVKQLRQLVACDVTFFQPYWPPFAAQRYGVDALAGEGRPNPELLLLLERELRRAVGPLPGEGEVTFRFAPFDGNGARMLAAEAERSTAGLVVVASPRAGDAAPIAFPPAAVIRACRAPLVCVPSRPRAAAPARIPVFRTVLVGTDLSDFSNQGVPTAYGLLGNGGGRVVICHAYERDPRADLGAAGLATLPRLTPSIRYGLEELLRQLAPPEAAALGITTEVAVIEARSAHEGLLQEAERIDADVLVVASRGRSGLGPGAIMGSVAEGVARASKRPVLVLHPRSA